MQSMLVQPKDDRFYIPITARASHHHLSTMGCLSLGQFLYLSEPHSSQEPNLENLSRQWLLEIPMSNGDDQAIQLPSAQRNMRTMQWIMFKINKYFQYDTIPGIDPVRLQIVQRHQYRHDFDYGTVMRYKGTNLETILRYARCAGFRVACVCNTGWKPEYSDFIRDRLRLEFLIGISKADQIRCIEEWCSMLLEAMVVHLHAVIGRSNMGRFIAGCLEDNYKDFQLLSSTVYTTLGERDSYVLQVLYDHDVGNFMFTTS